MVRRENLKENRDIPMFTYEETLKKMKRDAERAVARETERNLAKDFAGKYRKVATVGIGREKSNGHNSHRW